MKKSKHTMMVIGLLAFLFLSFSAEAAVSVDGGGATEWQDYSTTFVGGFNGTVGFVVSDVLDDAISSYLLINNLSHGNYPSGILSGQGSVVASFEHSVSGKTYNGSSIFLLRSPDYSNDPEFPGFDGSPALFAATSTFQNEYGDLGTHGSILEVPISLNDDETFIFSWAFATDDFDPYRDFSRVYFKAGDSIILSDVLGQVANPVPVPAALWLLGSGLVGLIGLRRKMQR